MGEQVNFVSVDDLRGISGRCDERKQLAENRHNEVRARLHELSNQLQEHANKLSLLEHQDKAVVADVHNLKSQLDELDEIIRGGGPNEPGVVELLGRATRGIEDLRKMQKDNDEDRKATLNGIQSNVAQLLQKDSQNSGEYTMLEKLGAFLLFLTSLGSFVVGLVALIKK